MICMRILKVNQDGRPLEGANTFLAECCLFAILNVFLTLIFSADVAVMGELPNEDASHAVEAHIRPGTGGFFSFIINTQSVQALGDVAVRLLEVFGRTAVKLSLIYAGHDLLKPVICAAIETTFGGQRGDQKVGVPYLGSLHIQLWCFTDERFLDVLADYESGGVKKRLEKELAQVGLEVIGLRVDIENMEEVNERKAAIKER